MNTDIGIMENGIDFYNRMEEYRENILTVTVIDNINIPENAYQVFDVSQEQNEKVKAWLVQNAENTNMYDLYIGCDEGVEASNCNRMFAECNSLTSIN